MALVELAKFYDSLSAGVAQSRLEADGIESFLFDMGMTLQAVGFAIPVRLMVDEDDLNRARRILSETSDTGGSA
ncbi:MAG TPA: DUF2007 domain-containing protein [Allosphingosinicella sp.]|jgi:hypothetical protein|nr:DUF2007 domain-containing protein [Allosphingosinicella sp.]